MVRTPLSCNLSELLASFLLYPRLSAPHSLTVSQCADSKCQQAAESQDPVLPRNR